jgi:hypothetical protein
LVKYDYAGKVVWKKYFGGGYDWFHSVTTVSKGFVAVGHTTWQSVGKGDWEGIVSFSSITLFAQISGAASAKNIMTSNSRTSKATLSARITLEGNYQTGNTDKANVSGTVLLAAIDSIKEFSANGRFLYGQNNKTVNQREYVAGIQYDYQPFAKISPFARFEYYRNEFRKINARYSGLIGAKYRYLVKSGIIDYSISAALLYDFDNYTTDVELPDKERLRLSVRPKFKHNLTENLNLTAEIYYKPNLANFDDYIICGNFNLNFRIFKQGLLRLSYEYEYTNYPATDKVMKTDARLLAGIGIDF